MSVHITGGSLGFSLGPLLFAPFAERFGLHWTPLFMIPALVVLAAFLPRVPPIERLGDHDEVGGFGALRPYTKPLALLYSVVVIRTLAALSFSTFMPVMLTRRGMSVTEAGSAMALYLFASSVGGFLGGPLADRWGPRNVIIWSLVLAVPFLALAPMQTGWTFVAIVSVGGFLLQSTLPVNVTFAQMIAPISAATVSSLMMGFLGDAESRTLKLDEREIVEAHWVSRSEVLAMLGGAGHSDLRLPPRFTIARRLIERWAQG